MKVSELLEVLVEAARHYASDAPASVQRNSHMSDYDGPAPTRDLTDAVIVDFINAVAVRHGVDLALYAKDLDASASTPAPIPVPEYFDFAIGALADLAFNEDMSREQMQHKARRIYAELRRRVPE